MMNMILQYMLKEVTVKDFLALSNPNECKKYVLFMANTLHKYFYELQVQPIRDRGGVIAFRSVRDLVAPQGDAAADREKQSLCLVLAYYYTRIFQIYGALALTLIDDISSMREAGMFDTGRQGLVTPGARPVMYGGGPIGASVPQGHIGGGPQGHIGGGPIAGGAISDAELGRFAFVKSFLVDDRTIHGWRTTFHEQNGLYGEVFFSVQADSSMVDPMAVSAVSSGKGVFTFSYAGAQRLAKIEMRVERVSSTSAGTAGTAGTSLYGDARTATALRATFEHLQYSKRGETAMTTVEIPSTYMARSLPLLYPVAANGQTIYAFRDTERSVRDVLQSALWKIVYFTKVLVEEGRTLTSAVSAASAASAVSAVSDPLRVGATGRTNKVPHADVLTAVSASEEGVVEELRLGKILHHLTQSKPYGHCIARGLQLLDTAPFPNQPGISHICKARFLESERGSSRSGLPEPGASLSTSPGLFALSLLFYDTVAVGTPKLAINQAPGPTGKSSLQQYVEFMRRIATYFGDNRVGGPGKGEVKSEDALREAGLAGIKNRRDTVLCKDHAGDIIVSAETARSVYRVVQDLFQTQLQHAAVCGRLFRMLFDVDRDASGRVRIALSEGVLRGGVPEINRINFLAREQLMRYYSACEAKYLTGVKIVVDSKRRESAEAAAAEQRRTAPQRYQELGAFMRSGPLPRAAVAPAPPAPPRPQSVPFAPFGQGVAPVAAVAPSPAPSPAVPAPVVPAPAAPAPAAPSPAAPAPAAPAPVPVPVAPSGTVPAVPPPLGAPVASRILSPEERQRRLALLARIRPQAPQAPQAPAQAQARPAAARGSFMRPVPFVPPGPPMPAAANVTPAATAPAPPAPPAPAPVTAARRVRFSS